MNTTPLNFETFAFIKKVFANIKAIKLQEPYRNHLAEEEEEDVEIDILSIDDDLRLQLPNITKFSIDIQNQRITYQSFNRLLCLFPNLIQLELDVYHRILQDVFEHRNENIFESIQQLNIVNCSDDDMLTDEQIHILFPNICHVDKPDSITD